MGKRSLKIHGLAIGAANAHQLIAHFKIDLLGPLHVIAHEEIEIPVVVVIEEGGAGAPIARKTAHTRARSDVGEFAAARIAKEPGPAHFGNQNVVQAVVVKISHGRSHAKEADVETGATRHVFKLPLAIVAIERCGCRRLPG
jgi:hypothetical protein